MASDTTIYEYFSSTQQNADRVHVMVKDGSVISYQTSLKTGVGYNRIIPFFPLVQPEDIITFTLGSTVCKCVKGTTWENWCSSAFNTRGYSTNSSGLVVNYDGLGVVQLSGVEVSSTAEITAGANYTISDATPI